MTLPAFEIEGTWEEIQAHAAELAGRKVRLTVLSDEPHSKAERPALRPEVQRTLEWLKTWQQESLTDEERAILDDFEQFRREHPFNLRQIKDRP